MEFRLSELKTVASLPEPLGLSQAEPQEKPQAEAEANKSLLNQAVHGVVSTFMQKPSATRDEVDHYATELIKSVPLFIVGAATHGKLRAGAEGFAELQQVSKLQKLMSVEKLAAGTVYALDEMKPGENTTGADMFGQALLGFTKGYATKTVFDGLGRLSLELPESINLVPKSWVAGAARRGINLSSLESVAVPKALTGTTAALVLKGAEVPGKGILMGAAGSTIDLTFSGNTWQNNGKFDLSAGLGTIYSNTFSKEAMAVNGLTFVAAHGLLKGTGLLTRGQIYRSGTATSVAGGMTFGFSSGAMQEITNERKAGAQDIDLSKVWNAAWKESVTMGFAGMGGHHFSPSVKGSIFSAPSTESIERPNAKVAAEPIAKPSAIEAVHTDAVADSLPLVRDTTTIDNSLSPTRRTGEGLVDRVTRRISNAANFLRGGEGLTGLAMAESGDDHNAHIDLADGVLIPDGEDAPPVQGGTSRGSILIPGQENGDPLRLSRTVAPPAEAGTVADAPPPPAPPAVPPETVTEKIVPPAPPAEATVISEPPPAPEKAKIDVPVGREEAFKMGTQKLVEALKGGEVQGFLDFIERDGSQLREPLTKFVAEFGNPAVEAKANRLIDEAFKKTEGPLLERGTELLAKALRNGEQQQFIDFSRGEGRDVFARIADAVTKLQDGTMRDRAMALVKRVNEPDAAPEAPKPDVPEAAKPAVDADATKSFEHGKDLFEQALKDGGDSVKAFYRWVGDHGASVEGQMMAEAQRIGTPEALALVDTAFYGPEFTDAKFPQLRGREILAKNGLDAIYKLHAEDTPENRLNLAASIITSDGQALSGVLTAAADFIDARGNGRPLAVVKAGYESKISEPPKGLISVAGEGQGIVLELAKDPTNRDTLMKLRGFVDGKIDAAPEPPALPADYASLDPKQREALKEAREEAREAARQAAEQRRVDVRAVENTMVDTALAISRITGDSKLYDIVQNEYLFTPENYRGPAASEPAYRKGVELLRNAMEPDSTAEQGKALIEFLRSPEARPVWPDLLAVSDRNWGDFAKDMLTRATHFGENPVFDVNNNALMYVKPELFKQALSLIATAQTAGDPAIGRGAQANLKKLLAADAAEVDQMKQEIKDLTAQGKTSEADLAVKNQQLEQRTNDSLYLRNKLLEFSELSSADLMKYADTVRTQRTNVQLAQQQFNKETGVIVNTQQEAEALEKAGKTVEAADKKASADVLVTALKPTQETLEQHKRVLADMEAELQKRSSADATLAVVRDVLAGRDSASSGIKSPDMIAFLDYIKQHDWQTADEMRQFRIGLSNFIKTHPASIPDIIKYADSIPSSVAAEAIDYTFYQMKTKPPANLTDEILQAIKKAPSFADAFPRWNPRSDTAPQNVVLDRVDALARLGNKQINWEAVSDGDAMALARAGDMRAATVIGQRMSSLSPELFDEYMRMRMSWTADGRRGSLGPSEAGVLSRDDVRNSLSDNPTAERLFDAQQLQRYLTVPENQVAPFPDWLIDFYNNNSVGTTSPLNDFTVKDIYRRWIMTDRMPTPQNPAQAQAQEKFVESIKATVKDQDTQARAREATAKAEAERDKKNYKPRRIEAPTAIPPETVADRWQSLNQLLNSYMPKAVAKLMELGQQDSRIMREDVASRLKWAASDADVSKLMELLAPQANNLYTVNLMLKGLADYAWTKGGRNRDEAKLQSSRAIAIEASEQMMPADAAQAAEVRRIINKFTNPEGDVKLNSEPRPPKAFPGKPAPKPIEYKAPKDWENHFDLGGRPLDAVPEAETNPLPEPKPEEDAEHNPPRPPAGLEDADAETSPEAGTNGGAAEATKDEKTGTVQQPGPKQPTGEKAKPATAADRKALRVENNKLLILRAIGEAEDGQISGDKLFVQVSKDPSYTSGPLYKEAQTSIESSGLAKKIGGKWQLTDEGKHYLERAESGEAAEGMPHEQPPAEQPPAEQPPAEQPPAEQPPAEQPPAEQPPVELPRVEEPEQPRSIGADEAALLSVLGSSSEPLTEAQLIERFTQLASRFERSGDAETAQTINELATNAELSQLLAAVAADGAIIERTEDGRWRLGTAGRETADQLSEWVPAEVETEGDQHRPEQQVAAPVEEQREPVVADEAQLARQRDADVLLKDFVLNRIREAAGTSAQEIRAYAEELRNRDEEFQLELKDADAERVLAAIGSDGLAHEVDGKWELLHAGRTALNEYDSHLLSFMSNMELTVLDRFEPGKSIPSSELGSAQAVKMLKDAGILSIEGEANPAGAGQEVLKLTSKGVDLWNVRKASAPPAPPDDEPPSGPGPGTPAPHEGVEGEARDGAAAPDTHDDHAKLPKPGGEPGNRVTGTPEPAAEVQQPVEVVDRDAAPAEQHRMTAEELIGLYEFESSEDKLAVLSALSGKHEVSLADLQESLQAMRIGREGSLNKITYTKESLEELLEYLGREGTVSRVGDNFAISEVGDTVLTARRRDLQRLYQPEPSDSAMLDVLNFAEKPMSVEEIAQHLDRLPLQNAKHVQAMERLAHDPNALNQALTELALNSGAIEKVGDQWQKAANAPHLTYDHSFWLEEMTQESDGRTKFPETNADVPVLGMLRSRSLSSQQIIGALEKQGLSQGDWPAALLSLAEQNWIFKNNKGRWELTHDGREFAESVEATSEVIPELDESEKVAPPPPPPAAEEPVEVAAPPPPPPAAEEHVEIAAPPPPPAAEEHVEVAAPPPPLAAQEHVEVAAPPPPPAAQEHVEVAAPPPPLATAERVEEVTPPPPAQHPAPGSSEQPVILVVDDVAEKPKDAVAPVDNPKVVASILHQLPTKNPIALDKLAKKLGENADGDSDLTKLAGDKDALKAKLAELQKQGLVQQAGRKWILTPTGLETREAQPRVAAPKQGASDVVVAGEPDAARPAVTAVPPGVVETVAEPLAHPRVEAPAENHAAVVHDKVAAQGDEPATTTAPKLDVVIADEVVPVQAAPIVVPPPESAKPPEKAVETEKRAPLTGDDALVSLLGTKKTQLVDQIAQQIKERFPDDNDLMSLANNRTLLQAKLKELEVAGLVKGAGGGKWRRTEQAQQAPTGGRTRTVAEVHHDAAKDTGVKGAQRANSDTTLAREADTSPEPTPQRLTVDKIEQLPGVVRAQALTALEVISEGNDIALRDLRKALNEGYDFEHPMLPHVVEDIVHTLKAEGLVEESEGLLKVTDNGTQALETRKSQPDQVTLSDDQRLLLHTIQVTRKGEVKADQLLAVMPEGSTKQKQMVIVRSLAAERLIERHNGKWRATEKGKGQPALSDEDVALLRDSYVSNPIATEPLNVAAAPPSSAEATAADHHEPTTGQSEVAAATVGQEPVAEVAPAEKHHQGDGQAELAGAGEHHEPADVQPDVTAAAVAHEPADLQPDLTATPEVREPADLQPDLTAAVAVHEPELQAAIPPVEHHEPAGEPVAAQVGDQGVTGQPPVQTVAVVPDQEIPTIAAADADHVGPKGAVNPDAGTEVVPPPVVPAPAVPEEAASGDRPAEVVAATLKPIAELERKPGGLAILDAIRKGENVPATQSGKSAKIVRFLLRQELVSEDNGNLKLTARGEEFLKAGPIPVEQKASAKDKVAAVPKQRAVEDLQLRAPAIAVLQAVREIGAVDQRLLTVMANKQLGMNVEGTVRFLINQEILVADGAKVNLSARGVESLNYWEKQPAEKPPARDKQENTEPPKAAAPVEQTGREPKPAQVEAPPAKQPEALLKLEPSVVEKYNNVLRDSHWRALNYIVKAKVADAPPHSVPETQLLTELNKRWTNEIASKHVIEFLSKQGLVTLEGGNVVSTPVARALVKVRNDARRETASPEGQAAAHQVRLASLGGDPIDRNVWEVFNDRTRADAVRTRLQQENYDTRVANLAEQPEPDQFDAVKAELTRLASLDADAQLKVIMQQVSQLPATNSPQWISRMTAAKKIAFGFNKGNSSGDTKNSPASLTDDQWTAISIMDPKNPISTEEFARKLFEYRAADLNQAPRKEEVDEARNALLTMPDGMVKRVGEDWYLQPTDRRNPGTKPTGEDVRNVILDQPRQYRRATSRPTRSHHNARGTQVDAARSAFGLKPDATRQDALNAIEDYMIKALKFEPDSIIGQFVSPADLAAGIGAAPADTTSQPGH